MLGHWAGTENSTGQTSRTQRLSRDDPSLSELGLASTVQGPALPALSTRREKSIDGGFRGPGVRLQVRAVLLKVKPLTTSSFLCSWKLARIAESLALCQSSSIEFCLLNKISTGFLCDYSLGVSALEEEFSASVNIWGQITLCCGGWPVCCRMLRSILGL